MFIPTQMYLRYRGMKCKLFLSQDEMSWRRLSCQFLYLLFPGIKGLRKRPSPFNCVSSFKRNHLCLLHWKMDEEFEILGKCVWMAGFPYLWGDEHCFSAWAWPEQMSGGIVLDYYLRLLLEILLDQLEWDLCFGPTGYFFHYCLSPTYLRSNSIGSLKKGSFNSWKVIWHLHLNKFYQNT